MITKWTNRTKAYRTRQNSCVTKCNICGHRTRDKKTPHDPVMKEGEHIGQKYDKRSIAGIPHLKCVLIHA